MDSSQVDRRRSSYLIGFTATEFDEATFDVMAACRSSPVNLFEIGTNSSIFFEISHASKGTHLILCVYPRLKESTPFLRHHPIIPMLGEYKVSRLYTSVKYSKKAYILLVAVFWRVVLRFKSTPLEGLEQGAVA